jgi:hypothetical protein
MKNKLGGLAFIKKVSNPENIGKVVTCIEYLGNLERGGSIIYEGIDYTMIVGGHLWVVESKFEPLLINDKVGYRSRRVYVDSVLQPIGTDDVDDTEDLYSPIDDMVLA